MEHIWDRAKVSSGMAPHVRWLRDVQSGLAETGGKLPGSVPVYNASWPW